LVLTYQSDQDFAKIGPIYNRGKKKKEALLDDVGGSAFSRVVSALSNTQVGGAKGKRSVDTNFCPVTWHHQRHSFVRALTCKITKTR